MKNTYFGVSIFENQIVRGLEAAKERGARMCAAGLLSSRYTRLHRHVEFLREAVGYQAAEKEIAQRLLKSYFESQGQRVRKPSDPNLGGGNLRMPRIPRTRKLNVSFFSLTG